MSAFVPEHRKLYSGASLEEYKQRMAGRAIPVPVDCSLTSFQAGYDAALKGMEAFLRERKSGECDHDLAADKFRAGYAGVEPMACPKCGYALEKVEVTAESGKPQEIGKWVVVDGVRYGIDERGIYRFRDGASTYDRIEAEKFAKPVATYIKEQGWKWEEVEVRYSKKMNAVCYTGSRYGIFTTLTYFHLVDEWSVFVSVEADA